jgi:hypothetical protein
MGTDNGTDNGTFKPDGQLAQLAAGTRMLNEASPPEAVRSVIHPSVIRSVRHTIPLLRVSDTAAFCPGGGGGRLEGRFFFSSCIWCGGCGEWTVHVHLDSGLSMQVLFGRGGGGFIFLSTNGKAQGALLLFLLSLGGGRDFFSIFPCFSMCSHTVPSKFLMGSQYVPQVHNVFLNMFSIQAPHFYRIC